MKKKIAANVKDLLELVCCIFQLINDTFISNTEEVRVQVEALLDVAFRLRQVGVGPVQPQSQQPQLILVILPALDAVAQVGVPVVGLGRNVFHPHAKFFQLPPSFHRSAVVRRCQLRYLIHSLLVGLIFVCYETKLLYVFIYLFIHLFIY